ncbi:MAG: bile acid:sodium symporter family protein, partial [Propionibacteriaceae bacterium]
MSVLSRLRLDPFMLAIITAASLGTLLPVHGVGIDVLSGITTAAIALLFFLYGARLHPQEALAGVKNWRLHLTILSFTYLVFPLLGVALRFFAPQLLQSGLVIGLVYLTLCPSTVQSSIAFTSIARGNVAGAIVSASASNLLGVLLTPLLVMTVLGTTGGVQVTGSAVWDLVLQILVPFIIGQLSRRWTAAWVTRNKSWLKYVDQFSIVLVVYSAFSAGMRQHIWSSVSWRDISLVLVICLAMLAFMLRFTRWAAQRLGFSREDIIAIQFCGTKKSLATGLPMATVLFATLPVG